MSDERQAMLDRLNGVKPDSAPEVEAAPAKGHRAKGDKWHRWAMLNAAAEDQAGLTDPELRVYLVLFRHAGRSHLAQETIRQLVDATGKGRRSVINALRGLERKRFIRQESRGNKNKGASRYRLLPPHDWDLQGAASCTLEQSQGAASCTPQGAASCTHHKRNRGGRLAEGSPAAQETPATAPACPA